MVTLELMKNSERSKKTNMNEFKAYNQWCKEKGLKPSSPSSLKEYLKTLQK